MAAETDATEHHAGGDDERDERHAILRKFAERKEKHEQRGPVARFGVVLLGVVLILGGIVLSGPGIPGPGFLVILIGISFLALEFEKAERLLEKAVEWGDRAAERASATTPRQKAIAAVVVLIAVAAFVWAAIQYDIPLLPV